MIRVMVIDDEPAIRKDMELLMKRQTGFIVVGSCGSVQEARTIIPATQPDLLLLDIELSDGTGFDILQTLDNPCKIIFITAYHDYAIRAIKYGALDYLLKPVDEEELNEALDKVRKAISAVPQPDQLAIARQSLQQGGLQNRIVLRSQQYLQIVCFDEIVYCQSDAGYTTFFLTENRKIVVSKSIKEYEELLPAYFMRPHQSYLVNHHFIDRYHKDGYLVLRQGTEIPVSTRRKDYVIEYLTGVR
ncbi:response regulator transcription factor [Pseudoflavitalea sp. G-6-1-2]|uniref:LytR/AlgR family response regulator transcription factor n=1 Tax=Pseudoflavitalea sp. G-6-1-2 TaxID=2728841 RepID=UPI00146D8EAD|nr:LytTR family DNA-binding domain-containing protein [Pseudoflavitalea sp. G-6-1-2]NML24096.1 response regulator transcription factor [Pseudoflavitalea sp. G-6-1-2]